VKGLYLVQWLCSEIKLRIHTAPGMTIYPNPLSWAWSKIAKGTPILIIAPTGGRLVIRTGNEDQTWGSVGHVTIRWKGLRHLSHPCDFGLKVCHSWEMQWQRQWWMQGTWWDTSGQSSTYTHKGRDNEAGMEGGQTTTNGLRVAYLNRCQSWNKGS